MFHTRYKIPGSSAVREVSLNTPVPPPKQYSVMRSQSSKTDSNSPAFHRLLPQVTCILDQT